VGNFFEASILLAHDWSGTHAKRPAFDGTRRPRATSDETAAHTPLACVRPSKRGVDRRSRCGSWHGPSVSEGAA